MTASRLFLGQIRQHIAERRDFAFETTLAGREYLRLVSQLRDDGWRVELLYLALPNVEMSRQRVAERVARGGHAIRDADITRRFPRSLRNLFEAYSTAVDEAHCILNDQPVPSQVFWQRGPERTIVDETIYHQLMQEAIR